MEGEERGRCDINGGEPLHPSLPPNLTAKGKYKPIINLSQTQRFSKGREEGREGRGREKGREETLLGRGE